MVEKLIKVELAIPCEKTKQKKKKKVVYQIWYKTDQKTKCLIVRSLDNVLQQQHVYYHGFL